MNPKTYTIYIFTTPLYTLTVLAAPQVEARAANICNTGIYAELSPLLKQYPIALAYCKLVYPLPCTRVPIVKLVQRRDANNEEDIVARAPNTEAAAAWAKCQRQPRNVISTICSCIQTPVVSEREIKR